MQCSVAVSPTARPVACAHTAKEAHTPSRRPPPGPDSCDNTRRKMRSRISLLAPRRRMGGVHATSSHPRTPILNASTLLLRQILALEMHRGLRPLGAAALPPPAQGATLPGSGDGGGSGGGGGGDADEAGKGVGVEGSRAAAKAVEGFIRKNIEAYFGCWTSTYTLFSLDPRLVRVVV